MIIVLSKDEDMEMAQEYLENYFSGNAVGPVEDLFWQTDLDHEDMKYKIDVYVR